jgi:predicted Fe-S protein YdhL (DUF1289 family)
VSICLLNDADVCTGCFRPANEITDWSRLDDESRREVLRATGERMRDAGVLFD